LQFTLTISALSSTEAEALERDLENGVASPLAISRNETDEAKGAWELVAFYVTEDGALCAARKLEERGIGGITVSPLPEIDWVRRSLTGLAPVSAGRFFLHGSHDRSRRRSGGVSLEIDAGTAFGTGHHATTLGCLLILDRFLKRARLARILDVGCGTGVLGIAAAAASHVPVIASDIDREAVRVANANAWINGVRPYFRGVTAAGLAHPVIGSNAPYDLIFANILARPLIALAGALSDALASGGALVLSGFTRGQARSVIAPYRTRGLIPVDGVRHDDWVATMLLKPKKSNTR
jgi:ribosomal protein L11 methyltransferase